MRPASTRISQSRHEKSDIPAKTIQATDFVLLRIGAPPGAKTVVQDILANCKAGHTPHTPSPTVFAARTRLQGQASTGAMQWPVGWRLKEPYVRIKFSKIWKMQRASGHFAACQWHDASLLQGLETLLGSRCISERRQLWAPMRAEHP